MINLGVSGQNDQLGSARKGGRLLVGIIALLAIPIGALAVKRGLAKEDDDSTARVTPEQREAERRSIIEDELQAANRATTAKQHANTLAFIFKKAVAMGAPKLQQAGSAEKAVEHLRFGFSAGGKFSYELFVIPEISDGEARAAEAYLRWDDNADPKLVFHDSERAAPIVAMPEPKPSLADLLGKLVGSPSKVDLSNLAIARAEAINIAIACFVQSEGLSEAKRKWTAAGNAQSRYFLIASYLAFAPAKLADYMPEGHSIKMLESLQPARKVEYFVDDVPTEY